LAAGRREADLDLDAVTEVLVVGTPGDLDDASHQWPQFGRARLRRQVQAGEEAAAQVKVVVGDEASQGGVRVSAIKVAVAGLFLKALRSTVRPGNG
jgi:hypothetical protein